MLLSTCIDLYLKEKSRKAREESIKNFRFRLNLFHSFLESKNLDNPLFIRPCLLEAFVLFLRKDTALKQNTRYSILLEVRHFLTYLYENHCLMMDMSSYITCPKVVRYKTPELTEDDIQRCFKSYSKKRGLTGWIVLRNKVIFRFKKQYGLTAEDICTCRVIDIDFEGKSLRLVKLKKFIALSEATILDIRCYLQARTGVNPVSDVLFLTGEGENLAPKYITTILKSVMT